MAYACGQVVSTALEVSEQQNGRSSIRFTYWVVAKRKDVRCTRAKGETCPKGIPGRRGAREDDRSGSEGEIGGKRIACWPGEHKPARIATSFFLGCDLSKVNESKTTLLPKLPVSGD